jgi:hypothetical protein
VQSIFCTLGMLYKILLHISIIAKVIFFFYFGYYMMRKNTKGTMLMALQIYIQCKKVIPVKDQSWFTVNNSASYTPFSKPFFLASIMNA